jgi:hypothetical protein
MLDDQGVGVQVLVGSRNLNSPYYTDQGHGVAWVVDVLFYKPESSGFDSIRSHGSFSIYLFLPAAI